MAQGTCLPLVGNSLYVSGCWECSPSQPDRLLWIGGGFLLCWVNKDSVAVTESGLNREEGAGR